MARFEEHIALGTEPVAHTHRPVTTDAGFTVALGQLQPAGRRGDAAVDGRAAAVDGHLQALGAQRQATDAGQCGLAFGLHRVAQLRLAIDRFVEQQHGSAASVEVDTGGSQGQGSADALGANFQLLSAARTDADDATVDAQIAAQTAPAAQLQAGAADRDRAAWAFVVEGETDRLAVAHTQRFLQAAAQAIDFYAGRIGAQTEGIAGGAQAHATFCHQGIAGLAERVARQDQAHFGLADLHLCAGRTDAGRQARAGQQQALAAGAVLSAQAEVAADLPEALDADAGTTEADCVIAAQVIEGHAGAAGRQAQAGDAPDFHLAAELAHTPALAVDAQLPADLVEPHKGWAGQHPPLAVADAQVPFAAAAVIADLQLACQAVVAQHHRALNRYAQNLADLIENKLPARAQRKAARVRPVQGDAAQGIADAHSAVDRPLRRLQVLQSVAGHHQRAGRAAAADPAVAGRVFGIDESQLGVKGRQSALAAHGAPRRESQGGPRAAQGVFGQRHRLAVGQQAHAGGCIEAEVALKADEPLDLRGKAATDLCESGAQVHQQVLAVGQGDVAPQAFGVRVVADANPLAAQGDGVVQRHRQIHFGRQCAVAAGRAQTGAGGAAAPDQAQRAAAGIQGERADVQRRLADPGAQNQFLHRAAVGMAAGAGKAQVAGEAAELAQLHLGAGGLKTRAGAAAGQVAQLALQRHARQRLHLPGAADL